MISLRYHVVSLTAVFLALGFGILIGSSVVRGALVERLESDIERYQGQRNDAQEVADRATTENEALTRRLGGEIAPWALNGRLQDRPFIVISDREEVPDWREHVVDSLVSAGATPEGTIVLSTRLQEASNEDEAELERATRSIVPTFDPGNDVAASTMAILGQRLFEPTGRELLSALSESGYVTVHDEPDGDWPTPDAVLVVLAGASEDDSRSQRGASAFVRSAARAAPTVVMSDAASGSDLVTQLRAIDELPDNLATFDSATDDADPGGIGVTAAVVAAVEGKGGHYGSERGRAFIAPPGPTD